MKTFVLLLALTACTTSSQNLNAESGDKTTKTFETGDFTSLKLKCDCKVEISQTGKTGIRIEADESRIDDYVVEEEGNQVTIRSTKNHKGKSHGCVVYIEVNELEELKLASVGQIKTTTVLSSPMLSIDASSVGDVNLELEVGKLEVENSSVGNIRLSGNAEKVDVNNSGVGNVNMEMLMAKIVHARNSAVGNIHVYASEELTIHHTGVGNFNYSGDADVKHLHVAAVGKVKKK